MAFLNKIWQAWKRVGQAIGDFIARVVLTIFYFTLFVPFGLGVRLLGDPLGIKERIPVWSPRQTTDRVLDDARRQS